MPGQCPGFSMTCTVKMERSEKGWGGGRERSGESVGDNAGRGAARGIDPQLWHACAGGMVQLPQPGSKVIYFPQGHVEHAAASPEFPPSLRLSSMIPCRVYSVKLLADTETDEVYARICLQPELVGTADDPAEDARPAPLLLEKPASFVKTLTQSDANNGGGFSVPRYCAETIFPRLDYSADPPVQTVLAKDVHGEVWKFRHIYRGTPRRHLLTTGWSAFVNQKKLVAGDAIVFLRSASGELCVGVRRSTRSSFSDSSGWRLSGTAAAAAVATHRPSRWAVKGPESYDFLGSGNNGLEPAGLNREARTGNGMVNGPGNFVRNRARVTAKSVLEAVTLAAAGEPFQVVYYPRASISEFCVKAHAVKTASQQNWIPGMRFKMAFETEDSSRTSWFMGSISKVQEADPVLWPNSLWKMLQVSWDEPDLLHGVTRVSPWQVELVSRMQLPPFTLPKKKLRLSHHPEVQLEGQDIMGLTMTMVTNKTLGQFNPWQRFTDSVPAGMQGARHDRNYGLALQGLRPKIQPGLFLDGLHQHPDSMECGIPQVSTELNMGNFLSSECANNARNTRSPSLTVGHFSDNEPASSTNALSWTASSITRSAPFILFGKTIDTEQSVKAQQPQLSGGSSSDGPGHDSLSEGNVSEVPDRSHRFFPGQGKAGDALGLWLHRGESLDSSSSEIGSLNWFKEQASLLDKVKGVEDSITNCKVFWECEEVGHTVDLSLFNSYEEFYGTLSRMFTIEESECLNRLVYIDSDGSSRHIGNEPYRDFMKKARRVKILSESSSESMT